ncbi:MAG: glycosyltransferase family 4 protein [Candidatus Marinimicrobia bacterium]|nr:glycosyltransferase family 4 protein [Candidatus Neomarinimicrobiota bacterium]MBT6050003.1 glycosyltransferase family 4 protein [Candidatus Scalindua sp.]
MKVVFIYRKYRTEAYSIEELFHTVAKELGKQVKVIEYEVGGRHRILLDVWQLRKMNADIYHVTGDINYLVNLLSSKKTVLTVHDIGHYLFGLKGIKRWLYKWLWLVFPIRQAGAVTSISTETCENIVKHLGITGSRVKVIENCHSAIFKPVEKLFAVNCPVILQVGTKPYKNVPRLVEALKGLRCRLVLIGSLDEEIKQKLAECGIDYENYVGLTHEELYKQYVECDIVSFTSIGEGFGVPIIEAQASGRPLITSDVSPMREAAGEGACLVDPLDVSQIREGVRRIIADSDYRDQLVELGLRNVVRYSPATISDQYLNLYKRVIHS